MGKRVKIKREEKVLLHIYHYSNVLRFGYTPNELTQRGMVETLGFKQPDISNILSKLLKEGMVERRFVYVPSAGKNLYVYSITGHGERTVRTLFHSLKKRGISLDTIFPPEQMVQSLHMMLMYLYTLRGRDDCYDRVILDLERKLSEYYFEMGNYRKSMYHLSNALKIALENNEDKIMAKIYCHMGRNYMALGNTYAALRTYDKALTLANKIEDADTAADVERGIAAVLAKMGSGRDNISRLQHALKECKSKTVKAYIALTIASIFALHYEVSDAYMWFRIAKRYARGTLNPFFDMRYYNNFGMLYRHLDKHKEALHMFERTIRICYDIKHKVGLCYGYINAAYCLARLGNIEKATGYIETGKKLLSQIDNPDLKIGLVLARAFVEAHKKRPYRGIKLIKDAISTAKENSLKFTEALMHLDIAQIEIMRKRPQNAVEEYKKAIEKFKELEMNKWIKKIEGEMEALSPRKRKIQRGSAKPTSYEKGSSSS